MSIKLAGCVILDKNNQIYLIHRNKNGVFQWELPGGKVESNESVEEAATRELKEELGVTVNLLKKLGETQFEENGTNLLYTWFLANIQEGQMTICEPDTFDDLKSFSISEMAELKLSNNMKKLREAIMANLVKLS